MRKKIIHLMVAGALAFAAIPTTSALASITPAQQRAEIDLALDVLASDLEAEILALQTQLAALPPNDPLIPILQGQILSLQGRLSLVQSVDANLAFFPDSQLNLIIVRFDLPVSLS